MLKLLFLTAADRYLMENLKKICICSIDEINVLWVMKTNTEGFNFKFDEIESTCSKLIENQLFDIIDDTDLVNLRSKDIKQVLDTKLHRCSKNDITRFIERWKEANGWTKGHETYFTQLKNEFFRKTVDRVFLEYVVTNGNGYYEHPQLFRIGLAKFKLLKAYTLVGVGVMDNSQRITIQTETEKRVVAEQRDIKTIGFIEECFFDKLPLNISDEFTVITEGIRTSSKAISNYVENLMVKCIQLNNSIVTHLIFLSQ